MEILPEHLELLETETLESVPTVVVPPVRVLNWREPMAAVVGYMEAATLTVRTSTVPSLPAKPVREAMEPAVVERVERAMAVSTTMVLATTEG
jgi:hypothetical protein